MYMYLVLIMMLIMMLMLIMRLLPPDPTARRYAEVGEKLADPQYSGWFLHFNPKNASPYAVPPCTEVHKDPCYIIRIPARCFP